MDSIFRSKAKNTPFRTPKLLQKVKDVNKHSMGYC